MMTIHLLLGIALAALAIVLIVAFAIGRPTQEIDAFARWALGLLVVQVSTGVFLLTATEDGPGPWHVALPLIGLTIAAAARIVRPDPSGRGASLLGPAYAVVTFASVAGLVTGFASG